MTVAVAVAFEVAVAVQVPDDRALRQQGAIIGAAFFAYFFGGEKK